MQHTPAAQLNNSLKIVDPLIAATEALLRVARKRAVRHAPKIKGATLRPGTETPLWNALVLAVRPHLRVYGEKSRLARILGVPPQRVHAYFKSRHQFPDAERTLMLLTWLAQRRTLKQSG